MSAKDAVNKKSNQKNVGTIRSSNLCTEIVEYSDDKEYACCTLSSICLPSYVREDKTFDFNKLREVVHVVTKNLNKIIDLNYYPVPETELSNKKHRPLGIGVQGLADVFINMEIPFDSVEAKELNKQIFAVIYYSALEKSNQLEPRNPLWGWNKSRLLIKLKKPSEALSLAKGILKDFPDDFEGLTQVGACLRITNDQLSSLEYLDRAIQFKPDYAEALFNRGLVNLYLQNKTEALEDLETAFKEKPHIQPIWQTLLNVKINFELYQSALKIVKNEGKASTSFLQRKLQIGYNRAARIIDMMEENGVVSKANHVGKREILK